jgi:hypothetical protein
MTPPPLTDWHTDSLRVTAFPTADAVVTPDTWWKDLFGTESSTMTLRKGAMTRQEEGEALGGSLRLTVQPGRIEWAISTKKPAELPEDFPSLGPFSGIAADFRDLMLQWTAGAPPLVRLALGVNAFVRADDHQSAYGLLDALLPFVEVDPATTDLQYRVNRPRNSRLGIDGLLINRLATWFGVKIQIVAIRGATQQQIVVPPLFAVRTELDINTTADFPGPLPMGSTTELLHEFSDIAAATLERGDSA